MNAFEAGYLMGMISKIQENPEIKFSVIKELNDLKLEIVRLWKEKK